MQRLKNYFFTANGDRFLKNDDPTEQVMRDFLDSIAFHKENGSTATEAQQGLVKRITEVMWDAVTAGDTDGDVDNGKALYVPPSLLKTIIESIPGGGAPGDDGVGIASIDFTSSTGGGGAGEAGETDTYTITLTDASDYTFIVYNGIDGGGGTDENVKASPSDPTPGPLSDKVNHSIVVNAEKLQLVNDAASPASLYYYGTDEAGVKGFHPVAPLYSINTDAGGSIGTAYSGYDISKTIGAGEDGLWEIDIIAQFEQVGIAGAENALSAIFGLDKNTSGTVNVGTEMQIKARASETLTEPNALEEFKQVVHLKHILPLVETDVIGLISKRLSGFATEVVNLTLIAKRIG